MYFSTSKIKIICLISGQIFAHCLCSRQHYIVQDFVERRNYLDAACGLNPRNKRVKLKILILFSSEHPISGRPQLLFRDSQPLPSCSYDKGNKNMNMNIQHFWNNTDRVEPK